MNVLTIFEQRIGAIFEEGAPGARKPLSFKRLAKRAVREMEDETFVIDGVDTAPALYTVLVSAQDDALMRPLYVRITDEISQLVEAQAKKRGYTFVGRPLVRFMVDPALRGGRFSVFAENIDPRTLARLRDEENAYLGITPPQSIYPEQGFVPQPVPVHDEEPAYVAQEVAFVAEDAVPDDVDEIDEPVALVGESESEDGGTAEQDAPDEIDASDVLWGVADAVAASADESESEHAGEPSEPADEGVAEVVGEPWDDEADAEPWDSAEDAEPAAEPVPAPEPDEPWSARHAVPADEPAEPAPASTPEPLAVPDLLASAASEADAGADLSADLPNFAPASVPDLPQGSPAHAPAPEPAPAPQPTCTLTDLDTGETFRVTDSPTPVGRDRLAGGVVLSDPNVSRHHAELYVAGATWHVRDLNSTNGTLLNDVDVRDSVLHDGDVLTFGLTNLAFRAG